MTGLIEQALLAVGAGRYLGRAKDSRIKSTRAHSRGEELDLWL